MNFIKLHNSSFSHDFLSNGGHMGELIKSFDWIDNPLGPIEVWPQSLKTAVNIVLQSPVPLAMLWGPDGIMIYNDAYSVFAGARHPGLLGSKVVEGWPEVADFNRNVMEKGLKGQTLSYKNQQLTLYRNNTPEDVWMDLYYSAVSDESGKPAGVLAIVIEITQRILAEQKQKKAENDLRKSEEYLSALVSATSDVIYRMSPDWTVMRHLDGRNFLADTSGPINDWVQKYIPLHAQKKVISIIKEAIQNKSVFQLEHEVFQEDGTIGWTFSRAVPVFDTDGNITEWFGAASDVTKRKLYENKMLDKNKELIRINNDLDNFIYTASHDLKAPIANIEGLINALKDSIQSEHASISDETLMLIEMIDISITKFKNTIRDLTDIAKIQRAQETDIKEIHCDKVIDDVRLSINDKILESNADIQIDVKSCHSLKFSKINFKSIVYNLLTNAIKYRNPDKRLKILIKVDEIKDYTILTVQDNGLGIKKSNIPKLFGMFKRFHTHVEGSGVGLYIIKRIVDNAGGKIEVESKIGNGTTFKVYFKN